MDFDKIYELVYDNSSEILGGRILQVVQSYDTEETPGRLYFRAVCLDNKTICCKLSMFALKMFLGGHLTIKDLFMLRSDEPYYIETNRKKNDLVWMDEYFETKVIDTIKCAKEKYTSLPKSMKGDADPDQIFDEINCDFINAHTSIPSDAKMGMDWLVELT